MKKAFLALIALLLLLVVFPTTVLAGDGDTEYEARLSAPERSNAYYNRQLNRYSQVGYGMPNCVAYAYGRIYEMNGEKPLITHGSAGDWWYINKNGDFYDSGDEPKLGAVAVWSGHVAVVEEIHEDGGFTISESHYRGTYFNTRQIQNKNSYYGQRFYGFIYTYNEPPVEDERIAYTAVPAISIPTDKPEFGIIRLDNTIDESKIVRNHKMLILAKS